jgi:hypothetical protein
MNANAGEFNPVENDRLEHAGQNILGLLQKASAIAEQNTQHAINAAHRLSIQLRASEDRIAELEAALRYHQTRADRAEEWLKRISQEIEHSLAPRGDSNGTQAPALQPGIEPYVKRRQKAGSA